MKTTMTRAGLAIITHPKLAIIDSGSVAMGILLRDNGTPECWCLFWERGGDWEVFEDGHEYNNFDELSGWEADACEFAAEAAIAANPETETDMEWFFNWAKVARENTTPN